jgi:hypothetical protein
MADPKTAGASLAALQARARGELWRRGWRGSFLISLQELPDPLEFQIPAAFDRPGVQGVGVAVEVREGPGGALRYVLVLLGGNRLPG